LKEDEREYYDEGIDALTPAQRELLTENERLQIVRGYQTYEPRMEETIKAFVMIAEWKETVKFGSILEEYLPKTQEFHDDVWKERIYGCDKYGHTLYTFAFKDIDTKQVASLGTEELDMLVAQKLQGLAKFKERRDRECDEAGRQRYKHSIVIDLAGAGTDLMSGKKRNAIKSVIDVGSNYFPESLWKMYIVNTPWLGKVLLKVGISFAHPVTQAKIKILGKTKEAYTMMRENDGFTDDQIPDWIGGSNPGISSLDALDAAMEEEKQERAMQAEETKAPAGGGSRPPPISMSTGPPPMDTRRVNSVSSPVGSVNLPSPGQTSPFHPIPLGTML